MGDVYVFAHLAAPSTVFALPCGMSVRFNSGIPKVALKGSTGQKDSSKVNQICVMSVSALESIL